MKDKKRHVAGLNVNLLTCSNIKKKVNAVDLFPACLKLLQARSNGDDFSGFTASTFSILNYLLLSAILSMKVQNFQTLIKLYVFSGWFIQKLKELYSEETRK